MRRFILVLALASVACTTVVVWMAPAAAAQRWRSIASGGMNISDEIGLVRDHGALHVAWRRSDQSGQDLIDTPITASGQPGSPVTVVSGWASVGSPALVRSPTGVLGVFFPGVKTLVTGDPTYGLDYAERNSVGGSWNVFPAAVAQNEFAFARTPAATAGVSVGAPPLEAWYGTDQTVVHSGLDPSVAPVGGYGAGTDQALVSFGPDSAMVAWCTEPGGVFVAEVNRETGVRSGPVVHLPSSGRCPAATRVAMVTFGRQTEYVEVAASTPNGRAVRVYSIRHGLFAGVFTVASGSSFKQQIALAADPGSRALWVGWKDSDSGTLVIRRFRVGGTWGAEVSVPLPADQSISQLNLNAQRGRVDVIARTSDANNTVNLLTTQVLPGLTLKLIPGNKLEVLDAGYPVRGATIRVAKHKLTTTDAGSAATQLPSGSYRATASKAGYAEASLRFRIP